jgi:hypothetical protein
MSVVAEILALFDIKYTEVGGGCVNIFENKKSGKYKKVDNCNAECSVDWICESFHYYHPGISFLFFLSPGLCVRVRCRTRHRHHVAEMRIPFHFSKRGNYIAARHCMCIVSKITDGFILPFWRGFPHEEKVKLQHVMYY